METRTLIAIMTYEPTFTREDSEGLMEYYRANFDSFRNPINAGITTLCISDFGSSPAFKKFLRSYAEDRGCCVIDSAQNASVMVAFNVAIRTFPADFVVYSASDVRVRDPLWLSRLLEDAKDPETGMVQTTSTTDGALFQTQSGPRDIPSRTLVFPEILNLHCVLFRREVLEPFENRYPDIFDTNYSEYCMMFILAALGLKGKANFRVNVIHDRFHDGKRHHRLHESNWKVRSGIYEKDTRQWQLRQYFLPIGRITSKIDWRHPMSLYRLIRYHIVLTKREGWSYWFFKWFRTPAFHNFLRLDKNVRTALVKALFFRPAADYQQYQFEVLQPSEKALARAAEGSRS